MAKDQSLNLHQRMLAIIHDLGAVEKTGDLAVNRRKKTFEIDHVIDSIRPHLVKHGVMVWPTVVDSTFQTLQEKQRTLYVTTQTVRLTFVNVDAPDEQVSIEAEGDGFDYSDKAPGKAFAYALKTALLGAFHMRGQPHSETDDIQPEKPVERRAKQGSDGPLASPADVNRLTSLANDPRAAEIKVADLPISEHLRALLEKGPTVKQAQAAIEWAKDKLAANDKKGAAA